MYENEMDSEIISNKFGILFQPVNLMECMWLLTGI